MNLTKEDVDKLPQLDRIEWRQKILWERSNFNLHFQIYIYALILATLLIFDGNLIGGLLIAFMGVLIAICANLISSNTYKEINCQYFDIIKTVKKKK